MYNVKFETSVYKFEAHYFGRALHRLGTTTAVVAALFTIVNFFRDHKTLLKATDLYLKIIVPLLRVTSYSFNCIIL